MVLTLLIKALTRMLCQQNKAARPHFKSREMQVMPQDLKKHPLVQLDVVAGPVNLYNFLALY